MSDEFVLEDSPEFEAIPDGTIAPAEVLQVERRTPPWEDAREEVSFKFLITDGEHEGRMVWGRTPTTFTNHPDCKLRVWVQELLGQRNLPVGFKFKPSNLEGVPCRIAVTAYTKEGGDGTKVTKNYVSDVLAPAEVDIDPF